MLMRESKRLLFFRSLSSFLIPLFMTCGLTFLSIWYLNDFVREKNTKIADNIARQLRADLDEMLHEVDLVILSYATDLDFFKRLGKLFSAERLSYDELQLLRAFQGTVDISAKIRPYIYSIYCVPDTPVVSAPFMVSMDGVTSLVNYPDRDFIRSIRNGSQDKGIVVRKSNAGQNQIMSVPLISKYSLVRSVDGRRIEGALVINLDRRYIDVKLNKLVNEHGDYLFLVTDFSGEVLLSSSAIKKSAATERDAIIKNINERRSLRFEGVRYFPVSNLKGEGGFTVHLLSSRSFLYATGRKLITVNILAILLSIIAGIVIIVIVTQKKYGDIVESMNYLENLENDGSMTVSGIPPYGPKNMDTPVVKPLKDYIKLHLSQRELKERKLELELLRNQLNPHFLLNTLQMLNWKIMRELKGYSDLNFIVENLSKILSYSLSPAEKLARLEDEMKYTISYVALQEYSRNSQITVDWELEDSMKEYLVPRLIFQPVIENAYKHAFPKEATSNKAGHIAVKFERHLGDLRICIVDNGVGMNSKTLDSVREALIKNTHEEGGIGLLNTNKRIQLLFGSRFGVQINSTLRKGTDVILTIPMLSVKNNQELGREA